MMLISNSPHSIYTNKKGEHYWPNLFIIIHMECGVLYISYIYNLSCMRLPLLFDLVILENTAM